MEKLTVEQALEALLEHTKVIEETETVPLLQACGRVLAKDMIAGFDAGADDYITKPFSVPLFLRSGGYNGCIRKSSGTVDGIGRD